MPGLSLSRNNLGLPEPSPSINSEINSQLRAKATTGQVVSSFVEDAFKGEGSLQQDIRASQFSTAVGESSGLVGSVITEEEATKLRASPKLSEDEWKTSPFFRKGLEYHPGMNQAAAQILAETEDDRNRRAFVASKATGWQTAAGFAAAFGAGMVEPKNLSTGLAAAAATEGLGFAVPTVGRLLQFGGKIGKYRALMARGGTEGALSAAITEPSNRESSKILQGDYDLTDSLINLTMSTVLGAGLQVAPRAIGDLRSNRREIVAEEFDTAVRQVIEGKPIEVEAVGEIDKIKISQRATKDLPELDAKIKALDSMDDGVPKVSERILSDTLYDGRVPDSVTAPEIRTVLQAVLDDPERPITLSEFIRDAGGIEFKEAAPDSPPVMRDGIFQQGGIAPEDMVAKAFDEGFFPGYKEPPSVRHLLDAIRDDAAGIRFVSRPEDFHYFEASRSTGGGRSSSASFTGFGKKQVLKAKRYKAQSEAKYNKPDAPTMRKLVDDVARPDRSTAYDPADSREVDEFLREYSSADDARAIDDLETANQEIAALKENDLVDADALARLAELDDLDADIPNYERGLIHAALCLTRG